MNMSCNKKMNILTILLLNIAFWVCNTYPKHILEFETIFSIVLVLINLIFFIVFDYILIIAFAENKTVFSEGIFNKDFLKKVPFLIITQLVFDSIVFSLSTINLLWKYIIIDILIAFQWMVIYFIATYQGKNVFNNKKLFAIIAIVLLGLNIISDIIISNDYSEAVLKYDTQSNILSAIKTNAGFIYSIKTLVLDSLLGILLIVFQSYALSDKKVKKYRKGKLFIQTSALITVICILAVTKIHFSPNNAIVSVNIHNGEHTSYVDLAGTVENEHEVNIFRCSNKDKILCYGDYTVSISKDGTELISISSPVSDLMYNYRLENGLLFEDKNKFAIFDIDSTKVCIYNSQAIICYENDIPYAISMEELNSLPENNIVTEVCKQTLKDGNVFIFEYCYEYLLKYDKSFIDEYINRYANGKFTLNETEWMDKNYYKSEYITNLAKLILNRY